MVHDGAAVVASDLTASYPPSGSDGRFEALRGIDLRIGFGEVVGVVGESGAGKSTLARVIAGRSARRIGERGPRITGGDLSVVGCRARRVGSRALARLTAEVGFLPQDAGRLLEPGLTVAELVAKPLFERDRRFPSREAGARAAELVDAVQLPLSAMAKYAWELSAGQRQRVAIARSLVLRPHLWVADEPTASVDVTTRGPVLDTLLALHGDHVFTAVLVSHDAAVMRRATDRTLVLHRGVLVADGPVEQVFDRPEHPYVAGLRADYDLRTGAIPVAAH